jgi:hypothetical protein
MSTKCTLSYDKEDKLKYHLYQECYENDNVWFQLDDAKEFKVWRDDDKTCVQLAIPVEIFRHAVEGWLNSEWGKNLNMDHSKFSQEDVDNFSEFLKWLTEKNNVG